MSTLSSSGLAVGAGRQNAFISSSGAGGEPGSDSRSGVLRQCAAGDICGETRRELLALAGDSAESLE